MAGRREFDRNSEEYTFRFRRCPDEPTIILPVRAIPREQKCVEIADSAGIIKDFRGKNYILTNWGLIILDPPSHMVFPNN